MRTALALLLLCGPAAADDWNPFAGEPVGTNPFTVTASPSASPSVARETPAPYAMRPGYGLELYTEESCGHCPEAKRNAAGSGVPVEVIDCNAQPQRAASHGIVSVPTWVLTQGGREVMRWTGPGKRSSVRLMAAYEAPGRIEAGGLDRAAGTAARVSGGTVPAPVASASDLSKTYKSPPNVPPGGWYPHPPVASGGYYTGPLPPVEPGAVVTSVDGMPVGPNYVESQPASVVPMRRAAAVAGPGMHVHTCRSCGASFSHADGSPANDHRCRNCGSTNLTGMAGGGSRRSGGFFSRLFGG